MNIKNIAIFIAAISATVIITTPTPIDKPYYIEPIPEGKVPRGMDYKETGTSTGNYIYYTDEEIRIMREQNPHLIIKVPGRVINSREEEFENRMEEYLETNPDALEDYIDNH